MSRRRQAALTTFVVMLGLAPGAGAAGAITGTYACSQTIGQGFLPADSQLVLKSKGRYVFLRNAVNANPAPSKGHFSRTGSKLAFSGGKLAHKRATIKNTRGFGAQLVFPSLSGRRHVCTKSG